MALLNTADALFIGSNAVSKAYLGNTLIWTDDQSLDINFMSATLNPLITYSRASETTYYDAGGLIQTAAVDEWPVDHDPLTGAPRGRQRFQQATNLLTYSDTFIAVDFAGWVHNTGVDILNNAGPAPDGTNNATLVTTNTSGAYSAVAYAGISWTSALNRSVYVKKGSWRYICIVARRFDTAGVAIDLDTGTIMRGGGTITALKDGWFRVSYSVDTFDPIFVNGLVIQFLDAEGTDFPLEGVAGETLYIFGAQATETLTELPYIPTTSSQVTRAADIVSFGSSTDPALWTGDQGGMVFDSEVAEGETGVSKTAFTLMNQTVARHSLVDGNVFRSYDAIGAGGVDISLPTGFAAGRFKCAFSFGSTLRQGCQLGNTVVNGAVNTDVTGVNIIDLGGATPTYDGWLRSVKIYPDEATEVQVQERSAI